MDVETGLEQVCYSTLYVPVIRTRLDAWACSLQTLTNQVQYIVPNTSHLGPLASGTGLFRNLFVGWKHKIEVSFHQVTLQRRIEPSFVPKNSVSKSDTNMTRHYHDLSCLDIVCGPDR